MNHKLAQPFESPFSICCNTLCSSLLLLSKDVSNKPVSFSVSVEVVEDAEDGRVGEGMEDSGGSNGEAVSCCCCCWLLDEESCKPKKSCKPVKNFIDITAFERTKIYKEWGPKGHLFEEISGKALKLYSLSVEDRNNRWAKQQQEGMVPTAAKSYPCYWYSILHRKHRMETIQSHQQVAHIFRQCSLSYFATDALNPGKYGEHELLRYCAFRNGKRKHPSIIRWTAALSDRLRGQHWQNSNETTMQQTNTL